tara:strand:+ start:510 stop:998 length:489 start_codon:yes stop_codon:yes gene_type:complete
MISLSNFSFIPILIALFSIDGASTLLNESKCDSSLASPVKVEFEELSESCFKNYVGPTNHFRIQNNTDYELIKSHFECQDFPAINFAEKELLGSVFSFTGTNEIKDEFLVNKDGRVIEFTHCLKISPSDDIFVSNVETCISKWILIDKSNPGDSVIFITNQY